MRPSWVLLEVVIMKSLIVHTVTPRIRKALPAVATLLALSLVCQPVFVLVADAEGHAQRSAKNSARMTEDQRIAHVLSRLTFGARAGDFERVKATGVDEFIRQQLDPDSIDDVAVQAR